MSESEFSAISGISDFDKLVLSQSKFIDKTLFIRDIMTNQPEVLLITRPRRFGKTLNLSMLKEFLSLEGQDLFGNLKIAQHKDFCAQHQNQYPVIFLTFKECNQSDFHGLYLQLLKIFSQLYQQFESAFDSPKLLNVQKTIAAHIRERALPDPRDLTEALVLLSEALFKHTGKRVIMLIDEYDQPFHTAYNEGYYEDTARFMRTLLGSALKGNPYLHKAVLTGITRVAQESLFSGLNNVASCSLLDDFFSQHFGFTESEVLSLLPHPDMMEPIRSWYNGYVFGSAKVYNPWSIIECLRHKGVLRMYWVNTSAHTLLAKLIFQSPTAFKVQMEALLSGGSIRRTLPDTITFQNLATDPDSLWTLLLHSGYVTALSQEFPEYQNPILTLALPNTEIRLCYIDLMSKWFSNVPMEFPPLIRKLEKGQVKEFCSTLSTYLITSSSYLDFPKNSAEQLFHVFLLGIFAEQAPGYQVLSNREIGLGRPDLVLIPKDPAQQFTIIFELKICYDEEDLQSQADLALQQIQDKKYAFPFAGPVLSIGLAFYGKQMAYATAEN